MDAVQAILEAILKDGDREERRAVAQAIEELGIVGPLQIPVDALLDAEEGTRVVKPSRPEQLAGAKRERALATKSEYRQRAIAWWDETQRTEAICDDCNTTLLRAEGYLRPGYLACESCTDKMVSGYYT